MPEPMGDDVDGCTTKSGPTVPSDTCRAACKTLLDSVPRKNYKDSIYGVAWLMVRF